MAIDVCGSLIPPLVAERQAGMSLATSYAVESKNCLSPLSTPFIAFVRVPQWFNMGASIAKHSSFLYKNGSELQQLFTL